MEFPSNRPLKTERRSHSLCSLLSEEQIDLKMYKKPVLHRTYSDSSVEFCVHSDTEECKHVDSGICDKITDSDMLGVLEQKIDRLSDMFLEQCRLLNTMKDEIRSSKVMITKTEHAHNAILVDKLKKAISQRVEGLSVAESSEDEGEVINSRAKSLLSAIESRREVSLDAEIKDSLINFLQSEELKDQMVRATAESVRGMIGGCFSRDMSTLYLPILERSHRRLIGHIHRVIGQAFVELEDKSSSLFKSVYKTSGALRRALERHQCLLEAAADPGKNVASTLQCTVEELLQNELKDWRQKVLDMFSTQFHSDELSEPESVPPIDYVPVCTPQPADPDVSVIDQLMKTALINKQIQAGDINGAFERALTAGDLSLVMSACRAADPGLVFSPPCDLKQHVLLSLIQQLATDMVHETQLKCRYLEEAMINLDTADPDTRAHLPLVVGEVRKHLSKFLTAYPNHVAHRRITLIVMAANNLLK
ncbi:enhancer of mRNA-decapping protein 4-like [Anticarsia gemmatalis]|uniref:enhancer of mRNA-decapping protein 4-like n=1 Tax=Anticarsia gemmatalis TaxID=129554 RepID=UPI003F7627D1